MKTVVLTGASRGIGHATVQRFSNEGWRIISCSRDDIPEHCKRDPNWAYHFPTDLSDVGSVDAFIAEANDFLGDDALHALVNNAAVSPKTPYKERLGCLNGDIERWREVFELNLFAPLILARGFAGALGRGAWPEASSSPPWRAQQQRTPTSPACGTRPSSRTTAALPRPSRSTKMC